MAHKIIPLKYYYVNAAVLLVLMILTVVFAKVPALHISDNPNGINLFIAVLIAILKAACIVSIFMGAAYSTGLIRLFALTGFVWLIIFFLFTFTDYRNPLEKYGSSYSDVKSPGSNPQAGGQDFAVHGQELAPASGGHYVPPPHLFGHGEGHGSEGEVHAAPAGSSSEHH